MIERSLHHYDHLMSIELQSNYLSSIKCGTTITLHLRTRSRIFFGTCTCQRVALTHGVNAGSDGDTVSKENLDLLNLSLLYFSSVKSAGESSSCKDPDICYYLPQRNGLVVIVR
jgi:hypothetical protein